MSQLRDKLIQVQKDETLKELLQSNYESTPEPEKQRLLSLLGDTIENGVDKMIREEIATYNENTPVKKKSKKLSISIGIINTVMGILLAIAVNKEEWILVSLAGVIMVLTFFLPLILED